jgi:hypothetical protein
LRRLIALIAAELDRSPFFFLYLSLSLSFFFRLFRARKGVKKEMRGGAGDGDDYGKTSRLAAEEQSEDTR